MKAADINHAAASLVTEITAVKAAIAALDERREELSFDALAIADNIEAKKALSKLHAERASKVLELEDLESALAASKRRIAEAKQAESAEGERERATRALPLIEQMALRGKRIDEALATYCQEFNAINDDINQLIALGCPTPTRNLVSVNLRNAHDAGMNLDKISRPTQPVRRRTFDELVRGWVVPGRNWIAGRLNTNADAASGSCTLSAGTGSYRIQSKLNTNNAADAA